MGMIPRIGGKDCGTIISCGKTDLQWYAYDQFECEVCSDLFWSGISTFSLYNRICHMWYYAIMLVQCIYNIVLSVSLFCEFEKEAIWIHIYIVCD